MEGESRKRGRETTESSEPDRLTKKMDAEKSDADGCWSREGEEGEEDEEGRGVFDFPWLKRGGVMTEEEWKEAIAAEEEEDTFLGSLGRCWLEREEVEIEQGLTFLEEDNSTSSLSLELEYGVSLEEAWDDRDGIWTSLLH